MPELPAGVAVKPGAILAGVQWDRMMPLINAVLSVWEDYGARWITITSGTDGHHAGLGAASLHPRGLALDFRTFDAPAPVIELAKDVLAALPAGYDVIVETDHLHGEYDGQRHTQVGLIQGGALTRAA